jgi:hypothetical protein
MPDDLRALLNDVAQGRIAPARAAQLIDELPAAGDTEAPLAEGSPTEAPAPPPASPADPSGDRVERVRITASARPVRLIGDPTVATVTVDGPHSVRREGSALRIDGAPLGSGSTEPAGSYRYERKTGLSRWLGQSTLVGVPLTIRINPDLAADVEVMAGSLEVVGLRGTVGFSVTAGSFRATDCSGPFAGMIRAGSAKLDIRPTAGHSSIRVESGSLDLRLQSGSDVTLTGRTDLGEIKVRAADGTARVLGGEGLRDLLVGAGTATLELEIAMGSAKVRLP